MCVGQRQFYTMVYVISHGIKTLQIHLFRRVLLMFKFLRFRVEIKSIRSALSDGWVEAKTFIIYLTLDT